MIRISNTELMPVKSGHFKHHLTLDYFKTER